MGKGNKNKVKGIFNIKSKAAEEESDEKTDNENKDDDDDIDLREIWAAQWKEVCDKVAALGPAGEVVANQFLRRLSIGAPVLLSYVLLCTIIHAVFTRNVYWGRLLGVHDTWQWARIPWQYTSLITHIFAHSDYNHLRGNMTHLLLTGPSVEHVFGSQNVVKIMSIVAVVSAFVHLVVGNPRTHQLGASGVVFAFILLNSLVSAQNGKIPVTFLIQATYYLGDELWDFFFPQDPISHHAHVAGGLVGAAAGFYIHQQQTMEKTRKYVNAWKSKKVE